VEGEGNGKLGFCGNQEFAGASYGKQLILEEEAQDWIFVC
jgi:hypothetical protein